MMLFSLDGRSLAGVPSPCQHGLRSIGQTTKISHAANTCSIKSGTPILSARRIDGRDLIYIDRHVLHELHAPHAFESLRSSSRQVPRPDLTFSMQDHTVATKPGRTDETNPSGAAFLRAMREGSAKNGIRVFDLGDPEQGISHVVAPELGMVLPGATHAVPDSHASHRRRARRAWRSAAAPPSLRTSWRRK